MKIRKAVIPVAGLGTRFLPASKAQPKEMITLVDKPVIQYIVEEAVAAGIEEVIFITSMSKRAIEDHFDRNFELEYRLHEKKKEKELAELRKISDLAKFVYVRQTAPLGDGHAVLQARHLVGDEPFVVLFGDDVIDAKIPCIGQMMKVFEKYNDPVLCVQEVAKSEVCHYGVIGGVRAGKDVWQVKSFVEKPEPKDAPSNLAVIGRYVLPADFWPALERAVPSHREEIRLADGFREYLKTRSIYALKPEGTRYDCGNKLGFLKATVALGLKNEEINGKKEFSKFLKQVKIS